jgi:hypothetical protein
MFNKQASIIIKYCWKNQALFHIRQRPYKQQ